MKREELKAIELGEAYKVFDDDKEFYLKSEADKLIAEKDKELRHQKYKRCLAKVEACMHKRWRTDEGFDYARSTRHMNKWLELAQTLKEAK